MQKSPSKEYIAIFQNNKKNNLYLFQLDSNR